MRMTTTTDGTGTYRKDRAPGQPAVLSHGRPGRPQAGNDMATNADDLAELIEGLDPYDAVLAGHPTGGEVTRYIGRHGTARVAKAVLVGAIPPLMLKTDANPGGLPIEVFDEIRDGLLKSATHRGAMKITHVSTAQPAPIRSCTSAVTGTWRCPWQTGTSCSQSGMSPGTS
jgi:pimeloyl-ACP methyl ester carboxylesterase